MSDAVDLNGFQIYFEARGDGEPLLLLHGDDQIRMLHEQMRGLKDNHDDMAFTPPQLATITARTLIVHGDRDWLYPVELALRCIDRSLPIPASALWVVPNGGHGPIFGALAPPFVETAVTFLRGWQG